MTKMVSLIDEKEIAKRGEEEDVEEEEGGLHFSDFSFTGGFKNTLLY